MFAFGEYPGMYSRGTGWPWTRSCCIFPGIRCASWLSLESMLESGKVWASVSARLKIPHGESAYRKQMCSAVAAHCCSPCQNGHSNWRWGPGSWVGYVHMLEVSKDMSLIFYTIVHRAACGRWEGRGQCLALLSCAAVLVPYVGAESGHYGEARVQKIGFADLIVGSWKCCIIVEMNGDFLSEFSPLLHIMLLLLLL